MPQSSVGRGELRVGRKRVVHGDRDAVAQLNAPLLHDRLSGLEPARHGDDVRRSPSGRTSGAATARVCPASFFFCSIANTESP